MAGALSQLLCGFFLSAVSFSSCFSGGQGHYGFMLLSFPYKPYRVIRKNNGYSSTERLSDMIIIHKNRPCQSVIPEM